MKRISFFLFIMCSCIGAGAQVSYTLYYDTSWQGTTIEKAAFFAEWTKADTLYKATSYYLPSKQIRAKGFYKDTTFSNPVGSLQLYSAEGRLEDSVLYGPQRKVLYHYHYYPDGKLNFKYTDEKNKATVNAYDIHGNPIENFIYLQEATFRGGTKSWENYISRHLNRHLNDNGSTAILANVIVGFVLDTNGKVTNVKIERSSGYDFIDKDAVAVIAGSPDWTPAIFLNRVVKAYRRQPLTYDLQSGKSKK